jgi:predicted membrane-bound spermidine synthase
MLVLFLSTLIGFVLGSWVFLRRTAPVITIRGFAGLRDLVITPKHPEKAIRDEKVIKLLVGLITCVSVILLFFALSTFVPEEKSGFSAVIFIVGMVVGPFAARYIARRTCVSGAD